MSTEQLLERLRKACLARGNCGIKSIGRSFRLCDDNGSGTLDYNEFKYGLKDIQVDFSEQEFKQLFSTFDADGSGSVNCNEFLRYLRPPMSKSRIDLIQKAFAKFDVTGDGQVTVDDIKKTYKPDAHPKYQSGEWTAKQVFEGFLKTFEPDTSETKGDGIVSYDEFLNYYAGVSASIDKDVYFDFMMRQSWKM